MSDILQIEDGVLVECLDRRATSVTIPDGVIKIRNFAFHFCNLLSSVVIPSGVTEIGDDAFMKCESLSSVSIPESVTKMGNYVLDGCKSLASVSIPGGVTEIGEGAFMECVALSELKFGGTKAEWKSIKRGRCWRRGVPAKSVICADGKVRL